MFLFANSKPTKVPLILSSHLCTVLPLESLIFHHIHSSLASLLANPRQLARHEDGPPFPVQGKEGCSQPSYISKPINKLQSH